VTGATGNLGVCVLRALAERPDVESVVGLARRTDHVHDLPDKVTLQALDLVTDDLRPVVDGADVVVHLAWMIQPSHDLEAMWETNVEGTGRLLASMVETRAGALVHASSIGAYTPGPKDRLVDESWPIGGHPSHPYSWQKATVEQMVGRFSAEHGVPVAVMRPTIMGQRQAATELLDYFGGRLVMHRLAAGLVRRGLRRQPVRFQLLHTDDAADAFARAAAADVEGPFNLATTDVLGPERQRGERLVANLAELTWRAHLQPVDPGWVHLAYRAPLIDASRAEDVLGWRPKHAGHEVLEEVASGLADHAEGPTPPLRDG
jgi:nucleoside-diphosphate-sugar epimerase